ncbi:hypothetical protein NEAUS03_1968 [Nematocida ausubeli]|nr:hypothetical protein NEAUS03_1968 [Nematocida ausubeli]
MWCFVIWVKTVALIGILLMNMCRANMTLDEVETTLQFEVATDSLPVKINPDGPLNFLRGLIYQKMECMYNKRFYAPQIDTNYFVEEKSNKTNNYHWYIYNRDRQIDKAYKAQSTNKMDVYAEKYHNHLIDLFPSPNGDITIETRGNQSFIQFLRAETTEKHALQILAMLLLFSEGVDIPIKVNNTVLKVYETEKKEEVYFEVPMEITWLNLMEEKVQTFQQKKVKRLINFFKENATNHEVLSMMEDKCSHEKVATGKFLDSPRFLIQSYIFGFIDSAEHAIEFIQTVHIMTEKYVPKTEAPSKDDSVYDRLFKPAGTVEGTDCMALMKETQKILNTNQTFPFADSTQLPRYTSVPIRNPITKEFSTKRLEKYCNCVECMILSLFCCLAYDPSDFTYKTDHMGNVSKELKEFFLPKKDKIFDTTKAEFQIKWCRVVACLEEPRIAYCKKRNELDCGIINMLMVIAQIVNVSKEEKDKIFGFAQSLKEQKEELHYKLSNDIQEYIKALFKRLSKTKDVEISFSNLKSKKYPNGRYDVSGKITMIFEHSNIKNTIVLEISRGHSNIEMVPTAINFKYAQIKKLNEIAGSCKNGATFIESLLAIYMDYEIRKIDTCNNNKTFMKMQVRKTIENNFADINRLLLIKKINAFGYKTDLVSCLIIYSMGQELSPVHPIICFTSNIIGSSELDNFSVRIRMILPAIVTSMHSKNSNNINYPKIRLFEETYKNTMVFIKNDYSTEYVLECDMSIFIIWAKYCIDNFCPSKKEEIHKVFGTTITKSIYKYIFREENMKYANEFNEAITKGYPDTKDIILNSLHNIWFIHLIVEENLNVELIKTNFHAIRIPNHTPSIFTYIRRKIIVQNFIKMKDHLCIDKDTIDKFNGLFHIYNSKPNGL